MNLPENLSAAASSVYELLSANPSGQSLEQLADAYKSQPTAEGSPKAIATADSLVVKGIIRKEGEGEQTVYSLSEKPVEGETDKESSDGDYMEGEGVPATNSANAEEQRMIDLLQQNDKKLPESKLFELYGKEQQPTTGDTASDNRGELEKALKELEEAGVIAKAGENYSIKK